MHINTSRNIITNKYYGIPGRRRRGSEQFKDYGNHEIVWPGEMIWQVALDFIRIDTLFTFIYIKNAIILEFVFF